MTRPQRTDALIAAALAVGAVVESAVLDDVSAATPAIAAVCLPVAWRRTAPSLAVVACAAALVAVSLSPTSIDNSTPIAAFVLCLFSFGVRASRRTLLLVTPVVVVLVESAVVTVQSSEIYADVLFTAFAFIALPLGAARLVRSRTAMTRRLAAQAEALEAEREAHAARAALEERTRMAADIHDLVAAGVHTMLEEVRAAERCADADDERCRAAIAAVEERGRDTLVEMRRLLGVLRREDEDLALAPQPSLARLDALAAHLGSADRQIALSVDGEPHALTPGVDVAAFRVVEEALAACGDAPADVAVRWHDADVELEVRCPTGALADGPRLAATRERVELFGGRVRAGRTPRGGSALNARLPTRERAAVA